MDLIADDELSSTVEAALAFIDSCTGASAELTIDRFAPLALASLDVSAPGDEDCDSGSIPCGDSVDRPDSQGSALQQKRIRNAVASTRSRKKRQTELLVLREEEALLRARLLALKERTLARDQSAVGPQVASVSLPAGVSSIVPTASMKRPDNANETTDASENTAEHADHKHRQRQRSEALNRRLRAALRKQRSVTEHLSQLVQKRLELKEVCELLQMAAKTPEQPTLVSLLRGCVPSPTSGLITTEKHTILVDLTQRLGPQVLSVDMALGGLGPLSDETMEFVSRTKQHAELEYLVELSSSTPLACSMEQAWGSLAGFIRGVQAESAYQNVEMLAIDAHTYKKECSMIFEDPQLFDPVAVDDISLVREAGSQNYRAFLWSALVQPRCERFHIRVNGWIALARSAANPSQRCVYRQQIEICAETTATQANQESALVSTFGDSGRYLQDFVLASMTAKVQRNQRALADAMLRRHGGGMPPLVVC